MADPRIDEELLAAARRRAARRRRMRLPRPRLATVVVVATLALLVLAAVAVVRGLEISHIGDERPAPPPGPGVAVALPAAELAQPCPGLAQRAADTPRSLPLAVFARTAHEPDGVPALDGAETRAGMVHGIAPDGIITATLGWDGDEVTVAVVENAFEAAVPLQAGDTVRVELEQVDACRPTPELLDAVPALRDGGWETLPAVADDAMPSGGKKQWVRHLGGDKLDLWAVARCDDAERACVLAIYGARWIAQPCGTAVEVREDGTWWLFPVAGRLGVAGLAPPRAARVQVVLDDREVHDVAITGGVFASILPPAFGSSVDPGKGDMSDRIDIRFR